MTWVKVCGLTRRADVVAAVEAGADAVGFVLVAGTPRCIDMETVRELAADVPVSTVVLTHGLRPSDVEALFEATGADGVQPYGSAAAAVAAKAAELGALVLVPGPPVERDWITAVPDGAYPLLDTPAPGTLGGTGRIFDWETSEGIERDFVLAGGLGPDNVGAAIGLALPWGVDASSRLESVVGVKDHGKVAAFVAEAKSA